MTAGALHYLTIAEAADRIRVGTLSPVALVQACLDRIAAVDGRLHAYITITADQALREARTAEAEIRAGRWRGPMHGIPVAHKDMVSTRGVRTTAHSNLLRDWVPKEDATAYTRLRQAGAISLGKLACWEFAIGTPGPDAAFPAARNPWHTDYSPGGSSSGSGAAVAAGLCLAATGTDTGGSIRHPAAVCGLVGLKPTFGRVSVHGVLALAPSYDTIGPMTRTVRDNAIMLQAMAGHDPRDKTSSLEPVPNYLHLIGTSIGGMRLGVPRRFIASRARDAGFDAAFEQVLARLEGLGAQLVEFDLPSLDRASVEGQRLIFTEIYALHRENLERQPEKYDVSFRSRVPELGRPTAAELSDSHAMRAALIQEYAGLFAGGIDAIVSPARETVADEMGWLQSNPVRPSSCTWMYNLTGMPALGVPIGTGAHGLPLGVQFAGPAFSEDRLYQIAAAYEAVSGWEGRHPPI